MPGWTESIALRRLRAQRLVGPPFASELDGVRGLLAVQAQDYPAARWALGQRVGGSSSTELDRLLDEGAVIRTHVLRPTWHLVAPEDLRWLLALTGPRVTAASAGRHRELGLDPEVRRQSRSVLERALAGGRSMTREEVGRTLTAAGIPASEGRLTYLVMDAELAACICSGPRRGRRQTYALVDERIAPSRPRDRDEALGELAARYVAGHGPARVIDLAWWSGLTIRDARLGLDLAGPRVVSERVGDRELWLAPDAPDASDATARLVPLPAIDRPVVHLLPNFDELLVAFRDRGDAIDPALPASARAPISLLGNVIVRNGLIVGAWRRAGRGAALRVELNVLVPLDAAEQVELARAVERLRTFHAEGVGTAGSIEAAEGPVLSSGSPSGLSGSVDPPGRDSSVGRARD